MARLVLTVSGERITCDRLKVLAKDVREDDFVVCEFSGFVHVHSNVRRGNIVELLDCADAAHIYPASELLDIARPVGTDGSPQ